MRNNAELSSSRWPAIISVSALVLFAVLAVNVSLGSTAHLDSQVRFRCTKPLQAN